MASAVQAQKAFGAYFAKATGLSPQIVGKWLAAEQPPGSAATPGSNNWLNIQYTDSGPNSTYFRIAHMSPKDAAYASAKWLGEQSGLRGILASAGKGVQTEARAIENSGWASSHYNGQLASTPGLSLPAVQGGRVAGGSGGEAGGSSSAPPASGGAPPVDLQALLAALSPAAGSSTSVAGFSLPKPTAEPQTGPRVPQELPQPEPASSSALLAVLSQLGEGAGSSSTGAPASTGTPGASGGSYVNPLPGFTKGRTDQGVDYSARPGASIRAIGNGRVLGISPNWYEGQPYVYYQLTDGPQRGKVIYVAEQIAPTVKAGDTVRAGQTIGRYASHGTGIETGYGTHTGGVVATPYGGAPDGTETSGGKAARAFLEHLGAR